MDVDMYLYPYDVIRMKNHLSVRSEVFLKKYTFSAFRDNPFFPNVMLRLEGSTKGHCPFLASGGCSIYKDRPSSCRTYPLERAVARIPGQDRREEHYFLKEAPHCQGHQEEKEWTVAEWLADQEVGPYNEMNDMWVEMDTIFRTNSWGRGEKGNKKLRMAFMACFNVDQFRDFVFESSFLDRFDVSKRRVTGMKEDDIEMMKFAFDWVAFFLTGKPTLTVRET
jgi:hypothetical protein